MAKRNIGALPRGLPTSRAVLAGPGTADTRAGIRNESERGQNRVNANPIEPPDAHETARLTLAKRFSDPFAGFYPPDGWLQLVLRLDENLAAVAPDYQVVQVKEKFGLLCYYVAGYPVERHDDVYALIRAAETQSASTCQNCSAGNASLRDHGWVATLCNACNSPNNPRGYSRMYL